MSVEQIVRRSLQSLVLLGMSAGLAQASTLTWYANLFGGPATNSDPGSPSQSAVPISGSVQIPKFDATLGTLNTVQIFLTGYETATVNVFNHDGNSSHSFTNATAAIPVTVNGPGGLTFSVSLNAAQPSGTVAAATPAFSQSNWVGGGQTPAFCTVIGGTYNPGTDTCTSNSYTDTENSYSGLTDSQTANAFSSPVSNYIGVGGTFVTLGVNSTNGTYGGTETGGTSFLSFGGSATAGAKVEVIYSYTAALSSVPEPFSLALTGGGLLGLAYFKRRKRSKA